MNKDKTLLRFALDQLASLYQSKQLMDDFFKVLQHKTSSEELKWHIFGQSHLIQARSKRIKMILAYFEKNVKEASSCAGIRGVLQKGFQLIHHYKENQEKDMAFIHALLLIHHYKLGLYSILVSYFHTGGLETEASILQQYVLEEERAIEALSSMDIASVQAKEDEPLLS